MFLTFDKNYEFETKMGKTYINMYRMFINHLKVRYVH